MTGLKGSSSRLETPKPATGGDAVTAAGGASAVESGPSVRTITDRFVVDLEHGSVWLDQRRMLILQAEWYLDLRRELIHALGRERARGILTRLGYSAGARDAVVARRLHPDVTLRDLILTGGQLHALQGTVSVIPLIFDVNLAQRHCQMEFLWKNSIEAQAGADQLQLQHEPTCWMEIGYASGFLTACLGAPVVVRETECRGMGDRQCLCVAKYQHEWDDPSEDLKYLQTWSDRTDSHEAPKVMVQQASTLAPVSTQDRHASAVGRSAAFNAVAHKVTRVSPTDATVLLLGESGVGKSLLAREIHQRSTRAQGPFVELNCAAIPENLLEAELFGVERGAYTGAVAARAGRFERAHGGTLFLDEIGTMSLTAQGKLLRVLQSREFERLGGVKTLSSDARLIAATNEDLRHAVAEGRFRLDLYYRVNLFPIKIPALRDRVEDLPLLIEHFLNIYSQRYQKSGLTLSTQAFQFMLNYGWPGNIRELENVLEHAAILVYQGETIDLHHLFPEGSPALMHTQMQLSVDGHLRGSHDESLGDATAPRDAGQQQDVADWAHQALNDGSVRTLEAMERKLVLTALQGAEGRIDVAAHRLGVTRAQVEYRLKKWGFTSERARSIKP